MGCPLSYVAGFASIMAEGSFRGSKAKCMGVELGRGRRMLPPPGTEENDLQVQCVLHFMHFALHALLFAYT